MLGTNSERFSCADLWPIFWLEYFGTVPMFEWGGITLNQPMSMGAAEESSSATGTNSSFQLRHRLALEIR